MMNLLCAVAWISSGVLTEGPPVLSHDAITSFAPSLPLFLYFIMAGPQFLLPSWLLDLINSLPSPALKTLDSEAVIYAS